MDSRGGALVILPYAAGAANGNKPSNTENDLSISLDRSSRKITVTWKGHGVLKKASSLDGHYKPVHHGQGSKNIYVAPAEEDQAMYAVGDNQNEKEVVSNAVGYVNVRVSPGLSLFATPLYQETNTLVAWFPGMPGGAQVYKYTGQGGFEVSTFESTGHNPDGSWAGSWSNPNLDITIGTGFYFYNPSTETFTQTLVG